MRIAIIGCGFVADYYMQSLGLYPNLELAGVMDQYPDRSSRFAAYYGIPAVYKSLDEVLDDPTVEMVVNLTNPGSHFPVSLAALRAGKHVYSEKPLATRFEDAEELRETAERGRLRLSSAPCNLLGQTAQSLWKALREDRIGRVSLAYAEMDDGMVFRMPHEKWISPSGAPWPAKDEFEVGCVLEHAGYYTTWLTAFFGPARSITAFSSCLYPDKGIPLDREAPDFSVACVRFESGVVARLTCGIIAPRCQRLRFFGDRGILEVPTSWDYRAPVSIRRMMTIRRRMFLSPWAARYPLVGLDHKRGRSRRANKMEFCRGVSELASSIREDRESSLPLDFCLHNTEIVLAIQNALESGGTYRVRTTFKPLRPMEWAR